MICQYGLEPVIIQRLLLGYKAILENKLYCGTDLPGTTSGLIRKLTQLTTTNSNVGKYTWKKYK